MYINQIQNYVLHVEMDTLTSSSPKPDKIETKKKNQTHKNPSANKATSSASVKSAYCDVQVGCKLTFTRRMFVTTRCAAVEYGCDLDLSHC